jgi:catechol 2,3-dioxygenase-like lactoylglutathione lyase family enzyme
MSAGDFEFTGVNHLALVCSDMKRTVEFYRDTLGMPLVKTVALPHGMGQHFFFDCGGGNQIAFFWFPEGPGPAPGIAAPTTIPYAGRADSAVASMNHVAISVPLDRIETYRQRLVDLGIECSEVVNHDDSALGFSKTMHPGVFVRSVYFMDPDGIVLELAAWTRTFGPADVAHEPASVARRPASAAATNG